MADAPPVRPSAFLNVMDVAHLLGVTARGARLVLERGELPGFRVGRRWFVRAADLEAAIAEKVAAHRRDREAAVRILRGVPAARTTEELP
jgi:excisionase family DNA binding protein